MIIITLSHILFAMLYLIGDVTYIISSRSYYENVARNIQRANFPELSASRVFAILVAYICLVAGWIIIVPLLARELILAKWVPVFAGIAAGAFYGFVVYGVFNGTNHAMFHAYDMNAFFRDLLWGTFWSSIVGGMFAHVTNRQK